ncbi:MAG: hypothetical protein ACYTDT_00350 [Planctomycetota bacterium]
MGSRDLKWHGGVGRHTCLTGEYRVIPGSNGLMMAVYVVVGAEGISLGEFYEWNEAKRVCEKHFNQRFTPSDELPVFS